MVPERRLAPRRKVIPIEHPRLRGYTPLDIITMGYMAITGIILAIGREQVPHRTALLLVHAAAVAGIALLHFLPRRGNILVQFFRDTYPMWALPFFYREVGILNQAIWSAPFDSIVMGWETALFGLFPSQHLHAWMPSAALNEFMHFSYITYYLLVPILGFWLYLRGRDDVCRVFGTTVMLTFFACYLGFIFFPVAGPFYLLPRIVSDTGFFPPLVHRILETSASVGAAFPSSHVAGAVTVLCMAARFERPMVPLIAVLCGGIFFGTVYGGFHYAVDAIAGALLGVGVSLVGPKIHAWLLRRSRLWPLRIRFPHLARPVVPPDGAADGSQSLP